MSFSLTTDCTAAVHQSGKSKASFRLFHTETLLSGNTYIHTHTHSQATQTSEGLKKQHVCGCVLRQVELQTSCWLQYVEKNVNNHLRNAAVRVCVCVFACVSRCSDTLTCCLRVFVCPQDVKYLSFTSLLFAWFLQATRGPLLGSGLGLIVFPSPLLVLRALCAGLANQANVANPESMRRTAAALWLGSEELCM